MSAPDRITKWEVGGKFFYEPPHPDLDPPCGVTVHGYLHETPAREHADELAEALRDLLPIAERNEAGEAVSRAKSALAKLEKEEGK